MRSRCSPAADGEVTVRNVPGGCRFDLILPNPTERESEPSLA